MKKSSNRGGPSGGNSAIPHGGYKVGKAIRAREVRLIDQTGKNLGIMPTEKALVMAEEVLLDLVQLNEGSDEACPIVKIMDLGKFLYEKKKQDSQAKKNQKVIEVKEIKLRPAIGENDYKIKIKQALDFLEDGKHVKITIQFRGREIGVADARGTEMFARIDQDLSSGLVDGKLESGKEGRGTNIWSRIFTLKGK